MSKFYTDPRTEYSNISHQASVVIQCTQDKRDLVDRMRIFNAATDKKQDYYIHNSAASLDNSVCRIDRGDLVFRLGTSSVPRGNLLNNAPPVSACLNGLAVRKGKKDKMIDPKDEEELNLKLAEGIQVLGVSLGATSPNPDEGTGLGVKNQITVRTQGTTTLFNNGTTNFVPGDTVIWTIPTKEQVKDNKKRFGRNSEKILLRLESMRLFYKNFDKGFKDSLTWNTTGDHKTHVKTTVDHFNLSMKKFAAQAVFHSFKSALPADITFADVFQWLDPGAKLAEYESNSRVVTAGTPNEGTINSLLNDIENSWNSMANDQSDLLNDALSGFLRVQADATRRKVGKCLSYSKPNTGVDVLLGTS